MPVTHDRLSTRLTIAGLGVATAFLLGACGSSSNASTQKVATLGSLATQASTAGSTPQSTQEALLAYASCMRANGVDMKDPTFDANGNATGGLFGPNSGVDPRSEAFQGAQTACGSLLKGVTLGGGRGGQGGALDRNAIQTSLNDFTKCLRDNGLTVDDITFGNGQGPAAGGGGFAGPPGGGSLPAGATAGGGSVPAGATGGSVPAGGFAGPPPGAGNGGGGGAGFDPTTGIIQRLGLDPEDPTVVTALGVCQPLLTSAFQAATSTTTTTP